MSQTLQKKGNKYKGKRTEGMVAPSSNAPATRSNQSDSQKPPKEDVKQEGVIRSECLSSQDSTSNAPPIQTQKPHITTNTAQRQFRDKNYPRQPYAQPPNPQHPQRQARIEYLRQRAHEAVPALRIRDVDFMEKLEDPIEVSEDGMRCLVQFPGEIFDALEEDLSNSAETTLVYKAMQPLVGMVFGKHGSAAHQLHELGATLELANKDRFHVKCARANARKVQEFFEEKLANVLVRLNLDNVTVVMRPEKLMAMLTPFCLTPVLVLGMITPHLLVLRIYDATFEELFSQVNSDMQAYYGSLLGTQLMDQRLSLPITTGTLACYFDDKSHVFMRVVVEEVAETEQELPGETSPSSTSLARIWKMDYGSYEWVSVDRLYRLQTCYLKVPRQCFVTRLLYAKKQPSCALSVREINLRYFSARRFFALSVMENPSDLSHVIMLSRDKALAHGESELTPALADLHDVMSQLVAEDVYKVMPYPGGDFASQLERLGTLNSTVPYAQLCREKLSDPSSSGANGTRFSKGSHRPSTTAETALQELVCPYERNPEKRGVLKYHGLNLSEGERVLKMQTLAASGEAVDMAHPASADGRGPLTAAKSSHSPANVTAANYTTYPQPMPLFPSHPPLATSGGAFSAAPFIVPGTPSIWPGTFASGMLNPVNILANGFLPPLQGFPTYLPEPWSAVAAAMVNHPTVPQPTTSDYMTPWVTPMPSSNFATATAPSATHVSRGFR